MGIDFGQDRNLTLQTSGFIRFQGSALFAVIKRFSISFMTGVMIAWQVFNLF